MTRAIHPPSSQVTHGERTAPRVSPLGRGAIGLIVALGLLGPGSGVVFGASVQPIVISGTASLTCQQLADTYRPGHHYREFRIDSPGNGTVTQSGLSVTLSNVEQSATTIASFDFTSNFRVDGVYVKTASSANFYLYDPNDSHGDSDLRAPSTGLLDHISFCYSEGLASPTPTPSTSTPPVASAAPTQSATATPKPTPSATPTPTGTVAAQTARPTPTGQVLGEVSVPTPPNTDADVALSQTVSASTMILLVIAMGLLAVVPLALATSRKRIRRLR